MSERSATNQVSHSTSDRGSAIQNRYASIDIGTNSVKVWVADCNGSRFPETVHEEIEITKLGQGLSQNRSLTDDAMRRTLDTSSRFVQIARDLNVADITIGATSAVRQARNQEEFLSRARDELKEDVRVITGELEAELTFCGVTYGRGDDQDTISVFDVGGGSTEFIHGPNTRPVFQTSVPVGSVQLYEQLGWNGTLTSSDLEDGIEYAKRIITNHIDSERLNTLAGSSCLIGVGGTVATIAQVHLGLPEFSKATIEGCRISRQELLETSENIFRHPPDDRVEQLHVKPGRSEYIASGAAVVNGVLDVLSASEMQATCRGLRHGLLIDTFLSSQAKHQ